MRIFLKDAVVAKQNALPWKFFRMTLSALALLLICSTVSAASIQEEKIIKEFRVKNVTLEECLKILEKKASVGFFYNSKELEMAPRVTVNESNISLEKLLGLILPKNGFEYSVKDGTIVVRKSSDKPKVVQGSKSRTVKGEVRDESGEPIPGVTLMLKGTTLGTSTSVDGHFMLNVPSENRTLVASFIGYSPVEVDLSSGNTYNITLKPESKRIEEVVVTGYQTISKERATGSFNIIKSDQIDKPTSNIAQRLVGTSAGVLSKTDVDGNVTFEIRGLTSLNNAAAQPLFVVDGFAIEGGLSSINPNDVESITILKDAAAASIWGARSANGVVVVTTKSGMSKKGKARIEFSSFLKTSPVLDLDYYLPYASSADQVDFAERSYRIDPNTYGNSDIYISGGDNKAYMALNEFKLGFLTAEERDGILSTLRKTSNRDEIKKYQLQQPFTQQYNLSIQNSSEKVSNVVSLLYEGNKSNLKGNDSKKYIVSAKSNVALWKWLDINFVGSYLRKDASKSGGIYTGSSFNNFLNEDGSYADVPNGYYTPNLMRYVPTQNFPYSDWSYNPLREKRAITKGEESVNARGQLGIGIKPFAGLLLESKVQYEIIQTNTKDIYGEDAFYARNLVNTFSTWTRSTGKVATNLPKGGIRDASKSEIVTFTWRNQLSFNKAFGDDHNISVIAGSEIISRDQESTKFPTVYGYNHNQYTSGAVLNSKVTNWNNSLATIPGLITTYGMFYDRFFSVYANGSYTYKKKYTISGSARADASNLITDDPAKKYSPFWSVGGSWNIKRESFAKDLSWINHLLLRSTYGYNGNVDKTTSPKPLISINPTPNPFINEYNASISNIGNPELTWERTGTLDVGVDFSLFDGKLSGKVDFYNKKGESLLVDASVSSITGSTKQRINTGKMLNRGVEVELGSAYNISKRIAWRGNLNFSYNHNEVTELNKSFYYASDLFDGGTTAYLKGENANTIWAFRYGGVINKGTEENPNWVPAIYSVGNNLGDFSSWDGDGREYMRNMGTGVAPYSVGLSNTFSIYDFDLSFMFTGKFGHVFRGYSYNFPRQDGTGIPNSLYQETLNADPSKRIPALFNSWQPLYNSWALFFPYVDYLVQNASHIRCQEVSLSYNVPSSVTKALRISNARLYAMANNLFLINFNKYNEDPEFPIGTIKPQPVFTFGLNVTF